ncbi:MAG: hypothetical protein JWM59_1061 [Verrucomicrobiales bacterium]|nr:hypothetical protein [Verrucomicrobiales bacterium]
MEAFGVKLTSGKIMWIQADEAECRDGAVVFYRGQGDSRTLVAGFSLAHINHFGVPSAFAAAESGAAPGQV